MAKVLVVGGAGYVGSSTCALLLAEGHEVWILDDLSTGHAELILCPRFICGKAGDRDLLRALFAVHQFECVFHFAARNIVSESMDHADEYFENNVLQSQALLDEMVEANRKSPQFFARFVFSSTCAIFGDVGDQVIHEGLPYSPLNPYAETKLAVENLLKDHYSRLGIQSATLRYFNASGAESSLRVGEWHEPETHLIPKIFQEVEKGTSLSVFGDDYPTADGTCVRDYVHVSDLASAHIAAMKKLFTLPAGSGVFLDYNLGSEQGYSVKEVIAAAEKELQKKVKIEIKPRRFGDAVKLVADSSKAKKELGFSPHHSLDDILSSARAWEKKRLAIKPHKAVFLDRDETMNSDPGYISNPDLLFVFPWVPPLLLKLKQQGYKIFVVSNQSGISRGLITHFQLHSVNLRLNEELFKISEIHVDGIANCPHHPAEHCVCRKPNAGLFFELAKKFNLNLAESFMIGDRETDREAGLNAGCKESFKIASGDQASFTRAIESILKT